MQTVNHYIKGALIYISSQPLYQGSTDIIM